MGSTVVVVTGPGHPKLLESDYVLRHVVDFWKPRGVRFELATDPKVAPPGDVAWQHLDVTTVDERYRELLNRYPRSINGEAISIAKRGTVTHLVERDDDWPGPVLIKTDRNFGGRGEDWAHGWTLLRHPLVHSFLDHLPARISGRMDPAKYPIFQSKSDVPTWVWRDRRFVVQRFLAERSGGAYAIRRWFFFGPESFAYRALAGAPIVMGDGHSEWTKLAAVPSELAQLRQGMHLDFGKIDYAEVDGDVVVYDVNSAVSADEHRDRRLQMVIVAALVPGLAAFLEG
ncbi:MAG: hypothetical protein AB7J35_00965 [Dehalococcoidia bacterium]